MHYSNSNRDIPRSADIVIVGAGMAGLYCAWRLLKQDKSRKVVIVDRLNRTGGRLDTDLIPVKDDSGNWELIREEEGGMRFTYSMKELMALFNGLNLCDQIVPFPMTGENNRYYFRGNAFTIEDATNDPGLWSEIYNLLPAEQYQQPSDILTSIYQRILNENGVTDIPSEEEATPEYWQKFRLDFSWNGTPLYKWTLWGLLRDMGFSEECIQMMAHTMGFEGPIISLMNAGEAFQLLEDFPSDPQFHTLKFGFSTLPNTLVKEIEAMGGEIFLSTFANRMTGNNSGGYNLELTQAPEFENAFPVIKGGRRRRISGDKIILALPRKSLQELFATSPPIYGERDAYKLYQDLLTTTNQPLCKINLYFNTAWWHADSADGENALTGQPGIEFGPSYTDLPCNTVYPFYPISGDNADTPAALTIYCDYNNTNFWKGLQSVGEKFDSKLQKLYDHKKPQTLYPASNAVVDEAIRQFKELYNTHYVPQPILTSFRLWDSSEAFGYAVHQWGLDAYDRTVIERLVEIVPDVYTCNEAFSDMQGWVMGSLRSAELVLTQKFGMESILDEYEGCQE